MSFEPPEPEDESDRQLVDDVRRYGWHVVGIPADETTPGWAFTVGLQCTYGHSEVVVFGQPMETCHKLLNQIGEAIAAGRTLDTQVPYSGFLLSFDCIFRQVQPKWHVPFLGTARWFYRGDHFTCLQAFWPDRRGVFPWREGAGAWLRWSQPHLFEASEEAAGVVDLLATMEEGEG